MAAMIYAKELAPPFTPCEVAGEGRWELNVSRSFIGVDRSGFQKLAGSMLSDFEIQETGMPNELGQKRKGVMCRNPCKPWVEYSLVHKTAVSKQKVALARANHCRFSTAHDTVSKLREQREKGALMTKLRNCVTVPVDLDAKHREGCLRVAGRKRAARRQNVRSSE